MATDADPPMLTADDGPVADELPVTGRRSTRPPAAGNAMRAAMRPPAGLRPAGGPPLTRIESASVVGLAYEQIRTLILNGTFAPGERLGQVELAETLGISRTPVREALRRLAGEGLVIARTNHGFRVAEISIDQVMRRLEIRLLLEPGIARLAAERATPDDLAAIDDAIVREEEADDAAGTHDASRDFHLAVARATRNDDLVATLEAQWIVEVGRRLLARRAAAPGWRPRDVAEHRAIAAAIAGGQGDLAEQLMREHVASALRHWSERAEQS
jgi:DNA-binding GntR family transcriptional regulator